jgi:hypothetical protein
MKRISGNFGLGGTLISKDFYGPVIVTEDKVYLCAVTPIGPGGAAGRSTGGVVGAIIGAAVDNAVDKLHAKKRPMPTTTAFEQLPSEIRESSLCSDVNPRTEVIVISKDDIDSISYSYFSGVHIQSPIGRFIIKLGPWGVHKAKRVFAEYEWVY